MDKAVQLMSRHVEDRRNKNAEPKLKEAIITTEEEDVFDKDNGKVELIKIKRRDDDSSSALMDIELLVNAFKHYPIVFNTGDMCIHLRYDRKNYIKILSNIFTKSIPLNGLTDICNMYKTFVIVGTDRDKIHVLPKNGDTYSLFNKLEITKENMGLIVYVELQDLIPIYCKTKNRRMKNITDYFKTMTTRECDNVQNETNSTRNERQLDTSVKSYVTKLQLCFKKVTLPRLIPRIRLDIFDQYPVEDELYNYPTQVSSGEQQRDEQVTSAGHSSIFSDSHSYAFGNSLHLFSNNSTSAPTRPTNPARYGDYFNYNERLASYPMWPLDRPTSTQLSTAGFFYTNQGDLVRCFQCGIGLKDFSADDDPLMEHVRHSGQCPFLLKLLGEERLATLKRQLQQVDPEFNRRQQLNGEVDPVLRSSYRHPEYQSIQARLSSFKNWPLQLIQTPQRLAEAGLYYTGIEDQVRCFACDGGLRRWDPEDDPWTEHCRWFPACPYALEQKGEQFIALVQASVENERFEASGGTGPDDMTGAMERLRLRDSETDIIIKQHAPICRDMGFEDTELKEAVLELRDRGNTKPSIEDIVDAIEVIRERKQANIETECNITETPVEENKRLKSHVFCMICGKNEINALFLPCTHHRLCMSCAEPLQTCAVCHRYIKEKIRTYMA